MERNRHKVMKPGSGFFHILYLCLRSRCPVCEKGRLFRRLLEVRSIGELFLPLKNCDVCGFKFGREPGYFFGIITPTLPILALATALISVIADYAICHPEDSRDLIPVGVVGGCIGLVLFFRTSIAIYVAIDHAIDPPKKT